MTSRTEKPSAYSAIIAHLFFARYKPGIKAIPFTREEIISAADAIKVSLPKNLGEQEFDLGKDS